MKRYLWILACLFSFSTSAQKHVSEAGFDIQDFTKKAALAEWLYNYALFSNYANREILNQKPEDIKRLGAESFCFEQDGLWHAVFGNFRTENYELVFHFVKTADGQIMKTTADIDSSTLNSHARALRTAKGKFPSIEPKREFLLDQFIKRNEDSTFIVCFLPAFQNDKVAIYGEEFVYEIDKTGTTLLEDRSYQKQKYKGFKVDKPRQIVLDYEDIEFPTLGALYFVWFYKDFFSKITIDTKNFMSLLAKTNMGWRWQHGQKVK